MRSVSLDIIVTVIESVTHGRSPLPAAEDTAPPGRRAVPAGLDRSQFTLRPAKLVLQGFDAGAQFGSLGAGLFFTALRKAERRYQDVVHGTIEENPHTVGEWLLIMESELNEAKRAWVKGKGDAGALEEILQVVTTGVACMEAHGVVTRPQVTP